jgi:hypothetical protein
MKDPIDKLITRTRQTFYTDGLWELLAGCISLGGGLLLLISPPGNSGAILFGAYILALFSLYSMVKRRLVYPRSGYAVYKGQGLKAYISVILKRAVLLTILTGLFLILSAQNTVMPQAWLVLLLGIFIGIGWIWQGIRLRILRLMLLGVITLLIGAALSPFLDLASGQSLSVSDRISWYFLLLGAAFLISGGITFWKYLRTPWQEGDETT